MITTKKELEAESKLQNERRRGFMGMTDGDFTSLIIIQSKSY